MIYCCPPSSKKWAGTYNNADKDERVEDGSQSLVWLEANLPVEIQERFKVMCHTSAFRDLDRNHDGLISGDELRDACRRWNLPEASVDKVLRLFDRNGDGTIDFNIRVSQDYFVF